MLKNDTASAASSPEANSVPSALYSNQSESSWEIGNSQVNLLAHVTPTLDYRRKSRSWHVSGQIISVRCSSQAMGAQVVLVLSISFAFKSLLNMSNTRYIFSYLFTDPSVVCWVLPLRPLSTRCSCMHPGSQADSGAAGTARSWWNGRQCWPWSGVFHPVWKLLYNWNCPEVCVWVLIQTNL